LADPSDLLPIIHVASSMLIFALMAGLLVAVAFAFLLPPLLRSAPSVQVSGESANVTVYRDQLAELDADLARGVLPAERHGQARAEIEQRLAEDLRAKGPLESPDGRLARRVAIAVILAVPIISAGVYALVGNTSALDHFRRLGMTEQEAAERQKMVELTVRLAARMQEHPEDPKGWFMLGRSYRALGKLAEAARAYSEGVARDSGNAEAMADLAETLALLAGGRVDGDAAATATRALALDPDNEKALALLGTAAFEARDFTGAIGYWQRLLRFAAPGSDYAKAIEDGIREARKEMGRPGPTGAPRGQVSGSVSLAPELSPGAPAEATVFIFAKALDGPPMPLAVLRRKVKDLPLDFSLDDSMAMVEGMSLSSQSRVVVGARVSRSGSPMPASGDLEGTSPPVAPGSQGVRITINRRVP